MTQGPVELSKRQLAFGTGLLLLWLSTTAYAFWWFQVRPLRPFNDPTQARVITFDGLPFARLLDHQGPLAPATTPRTTLLHFWDPDCPCSRFNQVHVRELIEQNRDQDLRIVIVVHTRNRANAERVRRQARGTFGDDVTVWIDTGELSASIPSSPAAAIVSASAELAYFGPYSLGAVCLQGQGDFVESVLARLEQGQNPRFLNTMAVGCFCDWPGNTPINS